MGKKEEKPKRLSRWAYERLLKELEIGRRDAIQANRQHFDDLIERRTATLGKQRDTQESAREQIREAIDQLDEKIEKAGRPLVDRCAEKRQKIEEDFRRKRRELAVRIGG